jgi:hypothetical protein
MPNYRLLLVAFPLLTIGCATVLRNGQREQQVQIDSQPRGAAVYVDDASEGTTPTRVLLDTRQAHRVRVEMAGYAPYAAELRKGTDNKIWWNLALLGLAPAGFLVDLSTGCAAGLKPNAINVALERHPLENY